MSRRAIARLLIASLSLQLWPFVEPTPAAARIYIAVEKQAGGQRPVGAASVNAPAGLTLMGPKDYVRTTGKPVLVTDRFARGSSASPFVLRIENGGTDGQYAPVSSAIVTLNGVTVVSPSDFPRAPVIEKTVFLNADNTLTVELRSQPGSGFTLRILGTSVNSAPVADAGPDQSPPVGATVTLDGSGSRDQDGDALTFSWSLSRRPPASEATLSDPTAVKPTFFVDAPGTYIAQLIVRDATTSSAPDTVLISTVNSAPVADAGPDQTVFVGTDVALDGSGSHDVDGNPLSYRWSLVSLPTGSTARLAGDTDVRPTLRIDMPGTYVAQLIVNDGIADSEPDTVVISTLNSPPVADAGPDQTVFVLTDVTLDASGSRDVDGDALTYRWTLTSRPASSTATLLGDTNVRPTFVVDAAGTYVAQVIVNDGTVDGAPDTVVISTLNSPPVADAGPDQTAFVGTDVTLDGSRSRDVDGNPLTFRWTLTTLPIGSSAVLSAETDVRPTFVIDVPGTYVAQLMVHDGTVDSAADTVVITTLNSAPVAEAGPDQAVFVGTSVLLNGGGSRDVDGDALTFRWALTGRPAGSLATLVNETTVTPSFFVDKPGTYVAQLIVNDGRVDSPPDTVTISTENSTPVADAGPDQAVTAGETVALDGRTSSDADDDPLTFRWALTMRPQGSAAEFDFATSAQPAFIADLAGTYVAQLIVNDGTVDSAPDTVVITAETANTPPIADAGGDQTVARGAAVQLDGSASSDPEGATLTFSWSLLSRPPGSAAVLVNASTATPTFTADVNGDYLAQLVVTDGMVGSAPDTVTITVRDGADLRFSFFGVPTAPPIGSFVALTVTMINSGPAAVSGATAHVPIPAGYTVEFVNLNPPGYDRTTGIWTVGAIQPHAGSELTFGLRVNPTGPYDFSATVTGSSHPDPNLANNTVTAVVTPNVNADLSISLLSPPAGTVAVGSTVGLSFRVTNHGPSRTDGVTARLQVAPGYIISGANPSQGSFDVATGEWIVGTLGAGDGPLVFVNATVTAAPGPLTVTATITGSGQPDPTLANNTATPLPANRPPIANAGPDQSVATGAPVLLDGGGSMDPDGDSVVIQWNFALRPASSAATLTGGNTLTPSLTPDLPGTYQARLTLTDSSGATGAADTAAITATGLSRAPIILSTAVTDGSVGQPYHYDVEAVDQDAGDTLTFSLTTAPSGMSIDAATGVIQWTPAESQGGPQDVAVRVQDQRGLFTAQAFAVQVSSAGNQAPVAADDIYEVRRGESLSVNAPGVLGNDTDADGQALTATVLTPPANGTLFFNGDGSFTFTPHGLQQGDLVTLQNVNLATRMPGVVAEANVADDDLGTSYRVIFQIKPFTEIVFPADVTVTELQLFGHREAFLAHLRAAAGFFQLFDANGTEIFNSGVVDLPLPDRDARQTVPNIAGVRRARFTITASGPGESGFAEFKVIGSAAIQRVKVSEPDLAQLLPTVVRASSVATFAPHNIPEGAIDDNPGTNWYATSHTAGEFLELAFPVDVTVSRIFTRNPSATPQGFGSSDGIDCSGSFTLHDAGGAVLFDSGVVHTPFGGVNGDGPFTQPVPDVGGVRTVRYTSAGCSGAGFSLGFSEFKVFGSADVTTPALGLAKKFHALVGREVHSSPLVINLTDDTLDGTIDIRDIPDIVVPVETINNPLTGEIKVLSGDDGRELRTIGAPNLVSPWSELAVADIDSDGRPDIVAVHSDGNHLIAFEATGEVKWISDANLMPRFTLAEGTIIGGAVAIANLDATGPPEIVVGASVFNAAGQLLGDGRTLGGTTGGIGLRSAISVVADLDLDGIPEIIAGPTAYRLVNGALAIVWTRSDRPDGYAAIGNFDDDPFPEIPIVANGQVYLLNHDGTDAGFWNAAAAGPMPLPGSGQGGAPTIADFDGDGRPEIGVAGAANYVVFNRDGTIRWQSAISDRSSHSTGSTVFDLDGDGSVEVIYRDERFLRIYRGADGVLLAKMPIGSSTWSELPVLADVDNDGHADIVVTSDRLSLTDSVSNTGVYVLHDVANQWTRTRRIWNQHSYHVTNVNEEGHIPAIEPPHWLVSGLNNFRLNGFFIATEGADRSDYFTYTASDGTLASNIATVRIAIRTDNSSPEITSAPVTTAANGVSYVYVAEATDPDAGDILSFSLPAAPAGMTIDATSGLIRWTPTQAQLGQHEVVVKVEDVRGAFALQSYAVDVANPVTVPDVVGQGETTAAAAIISANLLVGAISTRHTVATPAGDVISQSPPAGALAAPQSPVNLEISLGPPPEGIVPAIVGQVQATAEANITAANLTVGTVETRHDLHAAAGIVLNQSPAPGTIAPGGSPVSFMVSLGRSPADLDQDGDGFTPGQGDCDDSDAAISPGAVDMPGDGIDQNCNGADSVIGDEVAPSGGFTAPAEDAVITLLTDLRGSATDANFLRYVLELAPVDSTQFSRIGGGNAPVVDGVLGTLDPTLLENGIYRIRLSVEDVNGQVTVTERTYRIEGMAKVGNFRLSFVDLSIPVAGIPIQVVRTYDSRVKSREDFGIGWTLDIKRGFYQHNRTPGQAWQILPGALGFPCQNVSETASHVTTVRLSDFETYTFALTISGPAAIAGGCTATAGFRFVEGRTPGATLEILDGTDVIYLNGESRVVYAETFTTYNPSTVRLTLADGRMFDFDRAFGITRVQDLNGNALTISSGGISHSSGKSIAFARDAEDRITRITDPLGGTLSYGYDENGDLETFVDQTGNRTTFSYDARHGLVEILDPLGRRAARTEYDAAGRLVAVIDANGVRTTIDHDLAARQEVVTDRLGHVSVIEYDERGNVVRQVDKLGNTTTRTYDSRDNKLTETDALDHTRTFTYDASSNLLTETDPLNNTTVYTYNSRNQLLTVTDPRGSVTENVYDARGNLIRRTDALGNSTAFAYDARGNRLRTTDALGNSWTYVYDGVGRRIQTTDPLGNLTQHTFDANGNKVRQISVRQVGTETQTITHAYQYDGRNRLVRTTDPEGGVIETSYTATGRVASTMDPLGHMTAHVYDEQDRVVTTTFADGTTETRRYDLEGRVTSLTDRAGRSGSFTYDAAGRHLATSQPDGSAIRMAYDAVGRPTSGTDEKGGVTIFTYDAAGRNTAIRDQLGQSTSFAYDAAGNAVSRTDRNGNITTLTYDLAGRVTRTAFPDGTFTSRTYDAVGRLLTATDQAGNTTSYAYDTRGLLTTVTDALGGVTRYTYDGLGNRISQTDALGFTTRFTYDRLGRQLTKMLPLGQLEQRTYDAAGNLRAMTDFNGQAIAFSYDEMNRLLRRSLPGGQHHDFAYTATGKLATLTDEHGTTQFTYDLRDRPTEVLTADGTVVGYSYDDHGNRRAITTPAGTIEYGYDAAHRLTAVADPHGNSTAFGYDPQGNLTSVEYANGIVAAYTYDTLNRLTNLTQSAASTTIRSYAYTLGPAGNRIRVVENSGRQVDYAYDSVFRLTQERIASGEGPEIIANYTYDANGNRLSRTDHRGAIGYTYDANSRMRSAGGVTFTYDDNGNQVSRTADNGTTAYTYDALKRLIEVTSPTGATTRFAYDGLNNRIRKVDATETTNYLVDPFGHGGTRLAVESGMCCGTAQTEPLPADARPARGVVGLPQVLRETTGAGAATADYVYGGSLLISQQRGPGPESLSFYLSDSQMSIRTLTNTAGLVTDTYDYDAFGEVLSQTGATPNVYLYTGQQLDPSFGFYHLRARYYDPWAGRFTATDPYAGNVFDPRSLHPYTYVANDPVNFWDPRGENLTEAVLVVTVLGLVALAAVTVYTTQKLKAWNASLTEAVVSTSTLAQISLTRAEANPALGHANPIPLGEFFEPITVADVLLNDRALQQSLTSVHAAAVHLSAIDLESEFPVLRPYLTNLDNDVLCPLALSTALSPTQRPPNVDPRHWNYYESVLSQLWEARDCVGFMSQTVRDW